MCIDFVIILIGKHKTVSPFFSACVHPRRNSGPLLTGLKSCNFSRMDEFYKKLFKIN